MKRTDGDTWDLKSSVGATATMVAAARAVASSKPDPLINDPFAEVFVRAVGVELFTQIVDGDVDFAAIGAPSFPELFGIRSWAFDNLVVSACREGIRQMVILASGLDCRVYRMDWPQSMVVYEIDQPQVIDWKTGILKKLGCTSTVRHHSVGIDLRQDWPTALRQSGFDEAQPTLWIAEGLLIGYLPASAHNQLLDSVTELSVSGSQIVADYFDSRRPDVLGEYLNRLDEIWCKHDPDLNLHSLTFSGPRQDPAVYLAERGWKTSKHNLGDLFQAANRPVPQATEYPEVSRSFRLLSGIRV